MASPGMIKLVMIPVLIAGILFKNPPICSTHPPMKARAYNPKVIAPVASVEKVELNAIVIVRTIMLQNKVQRTPMIGFGTR